MKKLTITILIVLLLFPLILFSARTDDVWNSKGTYMRPTARNGLNVLIYGLSKYLNFNIVSGVSGYGLRDNAGTMEFKNSGGSWNGLLNIGGTDGQVQYNDGGTFGGASQMYWDDINNRLGLGDTSPDSVLEITTSTQGDAYFMISTNEDTDGDIFMVDSEGNITVGVGDLLLARDPTLNLHAVTKEYVDTAIGFQFDYFFNNTASGIGGIYYTMTDVDLGGGESTLTISGLATGDDQPLINFATLSGVPGIEQLSAGVYDVHVHAEKTSGTKSVAIYAQLFTRTSGGSETLIGTSETSNGLNGKIEFDLHMVISSDTTIALTDRLVIKFFANVGSMGNAVDVTLYQEGDTDSHFTLSITSGILSTLFLRLDGTVAMSGNLDMGNNNLINVGDLTASGSGTFSTITTDTISSSPLTLLEITGITGITFNAMTNIDDTTGILIANVPGLGGQGFYPKTTDVMDLGFDGGGGIVSWKDLYLAGTIKLGTNTITDGTMAGNWDFGSGNLTTIGLATFSKQPAGWGIQSGSVYINPSSAQANYTLLGLAVNGAEKFRIDEDGDIFAQGGLTVGGNIVTGGNAITGGGSGHDQFSDFVSTKHLNYALNLDANLIVWLRMDDIDGNGVPQDLGSESNTWTAEGDAVQTDDGAIGKAFAFDGTGDYLKVASPTGLPTGTETRTIVVRAKTSVVITQIMVSYGRDAAGENMRLQMDAAGNFLIAVTNGNIRGTVYGLNDGQWHTLGMTYDSSDGTNVLNIKVYVDGVDVSASGVSRTLATTDDILNVGISFDELDSPWIGEIDDVRIYDRELTPDEMLQIHQLGTLDAMTSFTSVYFKEYVASRSGFFNRLNVTKSLDVVVDLKVGGNLGIGGNATIDGTLVVADTVTFYGDLIADSGTAIFDTLTFDSSDPKVMGWNPTTRDYVKSWAEKIMAYSGGVGRFFNSDTRCFEIFEPSTGKFYKDSCLKDLEVVEQVAPIINKDIEPYYKWDKVLGESVLRYKPLMNNLIRVPEGLELNKETGELIIKELTK